MHLTFTVPGPPVPKARARVVNGHSYTPAKTKSYERKVAFIAAAARNTTVRGPWPLGARYELAVHVFVATRHRSDADNFLKSCADSLNGILWADDSQVDRMHVYRTYDPDAPRMVVTVEVL